jgi:ribosomal-protein-alanine acetyltransferase
MICEGRIRKASVADFEDIFELEKKCFLGELSYSRRQMKYLLTKAHRTFLVETRNGTLRGFIIILYRKDSTVAGLETIDVDPTSQKQGIGLRLLKAAEQGMIHKGIKKIRLEVSTSNHAAITLYKKEGFKIISCIKDYYLYNHEGSRDALKMIKELS